MTAGQLSKRLHLTTGAITSVIDRLEKTAGQALRGCPGSTQGDCHSRAGIDPSPPVYQAMGAAFAELLARYSTAELEFLVRFDQDPIEMTQAQLAALDQA